MIDLIVAGGGPVGLATAIAARMAGLEAAVVEPRAGCIDKACGEGLMPAALGDLARLGVDPPGVELVGIRYVSGAGSAQARFSGAPGRGVRRTVLQGRLAQRAVELGVQILAGRVSEVTPSGHGVRAAGLHGRYLVGADGLHSEVRRTVGLGCARRGARRYGVRQHFRVAPWSDLVEVHWLADTEVYVTPVSADTVGIAVLGGAGLNLQAAIAALPGLAANLEGCVPASAVRGAGPFRQSSSARVAGRVLLVGDAAGYVDALTGEGLRMGFAQARAAVRALAADQPAAYEADWRRITRSSTGVTNALLWVGGRPRLRPMIVPAARALPPVFGRIVAEVAG